MNVNSTVTGNGQCTAAAVNPDPRDGESTDGRWTYDVFFEVAKTKTARTKQSTERVWAALSAADHRLD